MGVRLVNPDSLVRPVGYSHAAVGQGRCVRLAGQIGSDASGRVVDRDDLPAQFARALDNLLVALRAAGGEPTDIASLRIYTTRVGEYRARLKEIGAAYRRRFGKHFPAMALLGVAELFDDGALVEIEGVAHVD